MTKEKTHFWETPYVDWITEIPENWITLVLYTRQARIKAKVVAVVETLCLLEKWNAKALIGGPFAEQPGVFWLALPRPSTKFVLACLPRLGYVQAVDLLEPIESKRQNYDKRIVRWRKRDYGLVRVYEEDPRVLRENAPDRRIFLLESSAGNVRPVRGYRGSGLPLERRGLPVYDARMLVNLVTCRTNGSLLDPFAGIGGIIIEAEAHGFVPVSVDIDPSLRYGLSHLSAIHCVADARSLPFSSATFDAIATEPPYHEKVAMAVVQALQEMNRVLKDGGRLAILCSIIQAEALLLEAKMLRLILYLNSPVNRKGLDLYAIAWRKQIDESPTSVQTT